MLHALLNENKIFIDDIDRHQLKIASKNETLFCPTCYEKLIYKHYKHKQDHFAHQKSDCSNPFSEPETHEHETGKRVIYNWLLGLFSNNEVNLEKHIKTTNQRADTFVSDYDYAVEFQCSPITPEKWIERHQLYEKANILDFWILGYSMHKYYNQSNPCLHKTNRLEHHLITNYNRLYYYDVLSGQFITLIPHEIRPKYVIGTEYFFKPSEMTIHDNQIQTSIEPFLKQQAVRRQTTQAAIADSKKTENLLNNYRSKIISPKKELATTKQLNFIYSLFKHSNNKIPYKLNTLLKEEADVIIKELLKNKKKAKQK